MRSSCEVRKHVFKDVKNSSIELAKVRPPLTRGLTLSGVGTGGDGLVCVMHGVVLMRPALFR